MSSKRNFGAGLFGRSAKSDRAVHAGIGSCAGDAPLCEALEARVVLSAVVNPQGILVIVGTPQADAVSIDAGSENGTVVVTGVDGVANGTEFTGVLGVRVDLRGGDDTFSLSTDLRTPGGGPGTLLVLAGNGQDTLSSAMGIGEPQMRGGNSHDTINGGPANDLLKGGRGIDLVFGNAGEDRLDGQLGRDTLIGGPDNDSLFGGFQQDELWGNGGIDLLDGGKHRDTLIGGVGNDNLFGRADGDVFGGSPGEVRDFAAADDFFSNSFNPEVNAVLLGPTFWNRLGAGEGAQTQRNTDLELSATSVLGESYFAILSQAINFRNAMDVQLTEGQQTQFRLQLTAVTNVFSPEVLANPAGLTEERLEQFRDDLVAAVAGSPSQGAYSAFVMGFFDQLVLRDYVGRVNALPANTPGTQAFLFGADSVFNVADLP